MQTEINEWVLNFPTYYHLHDQCSLLWINYVVPILSHYFLCSKPYLLCSPQVEAEYEAKESQEGTAKMKWDSKLRLRQSKLAAAGKSMDRAAVLALFLDEAIVAAEDKVRKCACTCERS